MLTRYREFVSLLHLVAEKNPVGAVIVRLWIILACCKTQGSAVIEPFLGSVQFLS